MKLVYCGAHDAVDVDLPFGGVKHAPRGEVVDIPDSLAGRLLEQPANWQAAPKTTSTTTAAKSGKEG